MPLDDGIGEDRPKWKDPNEVVDSTLVPADPNNTNNWYIGSNVGGRDARVSASRAADSTGKTQQIHLHPHGTSCEGRNHAFIEPDPNRLADLRELRDRREAEQETSE